MGKTNAYWYMYVDDKYVMCAWYNHVLGMKLQVNVLRAHELEVEHFHECVIVNVVIWVNYRVCHAQ